MVEVLFGGLALRVYLVVGFRINFAGLFGILGAVVMFACLSFLSVESASAKSNSKTCRKLNAQLVNASKSGGGNPRKYRRYQNAVRKQQNQMNKAVKAARRHGCVGTKKNRNNRCRKITSTIIQMNGNLISLKRSLAKYAPSGSNNSRKKKRIKRKLRKNGCYKKPVVKVAAAKVSKKKVAAAKAPKKKVAAAKAPKKKSKRRTLLEQVFGVRTYNNRGSRESIEVNPNSEYSSRYGTYRTLCVRKTDGYYFPVSFSTVKKHFDADEEACLSMCPNHDVALYVHRMPQEVSEDMVGYRSEIPYRSEPFAFAYRKEHNREIQCRFSVANATQSVDGTVTGELEKKKETVGIGIPNFRKDPADIPDAYDNDVAGMNWQEAAQYIDRANQPVGVLADKDFNPDKKIRIVGPAFFPVQ